MRHKGKREPLGRVESKPESISLPAGVSRMCVFPAPNSALCAFASLRLCVKALCRKNPHEVVNHCNCDTCTCLQLIAANCNYLHLIALVALVAMLFFFLNLATFDFALRPRPSAVLQTVPKSSTTPKKIITFNNF